MSNHIVLAAFIARRVRFGRIASWMAACLWLAAVHAAEPIKLQVTSRLGDGQTYVQGDELSFFVSMDREAYLLIVYADAGGNVWQILPNRYTGARRYAAGWYVDLPGADAPFRFVVAPPYGTERIWVFAADVPLAEPQGDQVENGMRRLSGTLDHVVGAARAAARNTRAYGEANTLITTIGAAR
jgi:hypothetical protein